MRLDEVIKGMSITDRKGRFDGEISRITSDSRQVGPGDLFVAIRGVKTDGHQYIKQAVEKGAGGILGESWPGFDLNGERPNVVLVPNSRRALALAAANFYGQPSRKLHVAGVTGTNGKTTVTYVLESIVKATSKRCGVIGTVECRYAGKVETLDFTTPDAIVLQKKLREMVDARCTHVVMEVSSHALEQQRVAGVHFKVCGFTNLSQDHLDYHGSMDAYFEAKARLFSEVLRKSRARGRMAVVNVDDPRGPAILERWGGKALRVSLDPNADADVVALNASYGLDGISATVRTSKGVWEIRSPLIGQHNLSNILVALGMALAMGISQARIMRGLELLTRVPGRLERIQAADGSKNVFVDYAHTPDALSKVLSALRPLTRGRLVVVFGCGGDRDRAKRPLMGKAVASGADLAIITNDNPRSEDPSSIARAIEQGMSESGWKKQSNRVEPMSYRVDLDRRTAIRTAIEWLRPEDVLVIAGKGHETYQIVGNKKMRFDDREEARRILAGLPPPPPLMFDDATSEVEAGQVEDAVELADGLEILAEARTIPTTESVEALDVVEAVDIEPDIVGEISDPGFGEPSDPGEEILEVEEIAEDADSAEVIEATEVVKDDPGDKKT
jgi:UDP-N-acetylmuramoyl-L-alanyl-D-glutamate--2,6-diaminopimelate ligase